MNAKQPSSAESPIAWLLAGLVVGALVGYLAAMALARPGVVSSPPMDGGGSGGRACTLEAKLCPDGTAVGRTGPNCEFSPCPNEIR